MAEWYQPALGDCSFEVFVGQLGEAAGRANDDDHPVRLLIVVAALTDEMFYSVFVADTAEAVSQVCRRAGWPVDRITGGRASLPPPSAGT
jgi:hypothetical protein